MLVATDEKFFEIHLTGMISIRETAGLMKMWEWLLKNTKMRILKSWAWCMANNWFVRNNHALGLNITLSEIREVLANDYVGKVLLQSLVQHRKQLKITVFSK